MSITKEERIFYWDNIKGLLIYLVVLGHSLEWIHTPLASNCYKYIYTFHIPLFILVSGFFSQKYKPHKILNTLYLYVIWQIFYSYTFYRLKINDTVLTSFLLPVWLMWYLLILIFYKLSIPMFDATERKKQILWILMSITISIGIGYDNNVSLVGSLQRAFSFFPFFLIGFYLGKTKNDFSKIPRFIVGVAIVVFFSFSFYIDKVNIIWLFNNLPYSVYQQSAFFRFYYFLVAIAASIIILKFSYGEKTIFCRFGKYSLQIYLLHGIILKILGSQFKLFSYFMTISNRLARVLIILLFVFLVCYLCGNKIISSVPFLWRLPKKGS